MQTSYVSGQPSGPEEQAAFDFYISFCSSNVNSVEHLALSDLGLSDLPQLNALNTNHWDAVAHQNALPDSLINRLVTNSTSLHSTSQPLGTTKSC